MYDVAFADPSGDYVTHSVTVNGAAPAMRRRTKKLVLPTREDAGPQLHMHGVCRGGEVRAHQLVPAGKTSDLLQVDRMSSDAIPTDEQPVLTRTFDTAVQLGSMETSSRGQEGLEAVEGSLEFFFLPTDHLKAGNFCDHARNHI